MIYLFNSASTPWKYDNIGPYYGKLISDRYNKNTKSEESFGLTISSKLPIDIDKLDNCVDMDTDCQLICSENTMIKYRQKDLKPSVSEITNDKVQNDDVIIATFPLAGSVIKNLSGMKIIRYRFINNEFIVYFTIKRNKVGLETPIVTLANYNEKTETDFAFVKDNDGYYVDARTYDMEDKNATAPEKLTKITCYRKNVATKLIFVHDDDSKAFKKIYKGRYDKNTVVYVNNDNIMDEINKYKNDGYKAASFFQNAANKKDIDTNEIVASSVLKNFSLVNALSNKTLVYIMK